MADSEIGANTEEARAAARISQRVSQALEGISKRFETLADNLDSESLEAKINGAFSNYYIEHKQAVKTVEANGVTIAENAEAAAGRIASTDQEAQAGFLAFPVNRLRMTEPHMGVHSPEYLAAAGVHDYDTNHIRREINLADEEVDEQPEERREERRGDAPGHFW